MTHNTTASAGKKGRVIELTVSKRFLVFNALLLLVVIPSVVISYSIDTTKVWHPLQWMTPDENATISVDENNNGVIDTTDKCGNGAACETKQVRITGGNPSAGRVLVSDSQGVGSWSDASSLPSGTILYFKAATCPAGWTALPGEQGRTIVGLTAGGTAGGTVGTPLANLENRPTPKHTHELVEVGHSHTTPMFMYENKLWQPWCFRSENRQEAHWIASLKGWNAVVSAAPVFTGITATSPTGMGDGTNAPYIQLLVCKKD